MNETVNWSNIALNNGNKGINSDSINTNNVTKTQVLCNNGTYDYDLSSPNTKYDNSKTCISNGGRAVSQVKTNWQDILKNVIPKDPFAPILRFPEEGMISENQRKINEERLKKLPEEILNQQNNNGIKAIFKNDYISKSVGKCPEGMDGCAPEVINYKKGDSFSGLTVSLSNDKKRVISNKGNYTVEIPIENFTITNSNGSPVDLTTTNTMSQSFLQKHKNYLLIVGAVVVGYFSYKALKK